MLDMYNNIEDKKTLATSWFRSLRDEICHAFESLEHEMSSASFKRSSWKRSGGGGGEISIMHGKVFEKVGVNISTVFGNFSPEFAKEIPGAKENTKFWASGISLVAHMKSPLVPAAHMNTRMIVTTKSWFGGGADLTPTFPNDVDTDLFHSYMKAACDDCDHTYYQKFKEECDKYFFLPHRNEQRGVGGIFYDYLNTGDWKRDFSFTKAVGENFKKAFLEIISQHMKKPWNLDQKEAQLIKRGRYAEFNLLYDRGTRFGLMTQGNTEAILMSLPPEVKWL